MVEEQRVHVMGKIVKSRNYSSTYLFMGMLYQGAKVKLMFTFDKH